MLRLFILLIFFLHFETSSAQSEPYLHEVQAQAADGILSLLRRYKLESPACSKQKFLELNNLKSDASLQKNKTYKLPVKIYSYNGSSIRSTIGDKDLEKAKRIQLYNELLLKEGIRKTHYKDSKILWVPLHELECPEAINSDSKPNKKPAKEFSQIPSGGKDRIYPIFGKKHEHVPLIDRSLAGQAFYIVTGHGGPDPGAIGVRSSHRLCEDEYAYDVALRLCRNLIERGAIAYMIIRDPNDGIRSGAYLDCDTDEQTWKDKKIPLNQKKRLSQRSKAINKLYKKHKRQGIKQQTAIMIHIDSRSASARADLFFYHAKKSNSGKDRALKMQQVMREKYKKHRVGGQYSGTVSARNLYVLKHTKPTSIYIEMGNIMNPNDQLRFTLERNRQVLADWLYEGLIR